MTSNFVHICRSASLEFILHSRLDHNLIFFNFSVHFSLHFEDSQHAVYLPPIESVKRHLKSILFLTTDFYYNLHNFTSLSEDLKVSGSNPGSSHSFFF